MNIPWQMVEDTARDFLNRGLGVVFILALGWLALYLLVRPLQRLLARSRLDPSVASFLLGTARSVLIVVIILGVLQQLGVQTASLLTLLATAGLAVALSLQGSLSNFASGLLLLSFRIARVGDWIEMGDVRGQVTELLPFHVVLLTLDQQRITVPNTLLTSSAVRNLSALPLRRVQWTLPLTPGDDLAAIKEALRGRLREDERILAEPGPQLYVQEWTEDKRLLVVGAWTKTADAVTVQQELLEALGLRLQEMRQKPS